MMAEGCGSLRVMKWIVVLKAHLCDYKVLKAIELHCVHG